MHLSPPSTPSRFARISSFPAFALLASLLSLTAPLAAQYAGNYSGTYTGDFAGVWSFTVDASGNLTGRAVDTYGEVTTGSGSVQAAGAFAMVMAAGSDVTFTGQIDASGNVTGIWEDSYWLANGSVTGSRLPATVALYAGTYSGTLAGDTTGTWSATVDVAGNWTGTGTAFGFGTFGVTGIVSGTGAITTYIEEGGMLAGQINLTGQTSGTWTDYTYGGTFAGNRTSTGLGPLEIWRLTHFESPENTGDGANTADPDQDGVINLLEFAFGLHPLQNSAGLLPKPLSTGGSLVLTFSQPAGVTGITYGAEWSPSMAPGTWQPLADTGSTPQHTFSMPMDSSMSKFVRLKVVLP